MHHIFTIIDDAHHQNYYLLLAVRWMLWGNGGSWLRYFYSERVGEGWLDGEGQLVCFLPTLGSGPFLLSTEAEKSPLCCWTERFRKSQSPWRRKWRPHTYRKWPSSRRLLRSITTSSTGRVKTMSVLWVWLITAQSVSSLFANVMWPGCATDGLFWRAVLAWKRSETTVMMLEQEHSDASSAGDWTFPDWRVKCDQVESQDLQCWVMREWQCERNFEAFGPEGVLQTNPQIQKFVGLWASSGWLISGVMFN